MIETFTIKPFIHELGSSGLYILLPEGEICTLTAELHNPSLGYQFLNIVVPELLEPILDTNLVRESNNGYLEIIDKGLLLALRNLKH